MSEDNQTTALRKFVDSAEVYIYVVDRRTDQILMVNDYYASMLGVPAEKMEGKQCWEFACGPDEGPCPHCPRAPKAEALVRKDNGQGKDSGGGDDAPSQTTEGFNPTLGIWGRYTGRAIQWVDGRDAHIITVIDVSNEKLLREELSHLAYYDRFMDIPNRTKLERDLTEQKGGDYCLVAFDYISLRYINDAYGRNAGDALMKAAIQWIKGLGLRDAEIYRIDGDSFCILLGNADMFSAGGLADRLMDRFQESWELQLESESTFISCKISVCVIDGGAGFEGPEAIISIIERTLDISKETGATAVYNLEMDATLKRDLQMEISLKNCVTEGMVGFDVYFQPIVDPSREMWIGLEALCRWESPEFGRIPPLVFIRMAEQIGLINSIGYWVLNKAIAVCARLHLHEIDGFFLDVNLSASQMSDETLVPKVLSALRRHNFPGQNLALEVTESEEIDFSNYSQATAERLRALDIKVALDDFGTGYSNFNNLKTLPVGILKTEKQFIDDIVVDQYQQFLTYVLVELAHAAEMKLIAEGVETPEQMRELMRNGADYYQGYLFAMPLTEEELADSCDKFTTVDPVFAQVRRALQGEEMS